ncbi:MAG: hypothetical protein LBI67_08140 [Treponema sp.]|nr:hypothetical protein [Treponema sp.]
MKKRCTVIAPLCIAYTFSRVHHIRGVCQLIRISPATVDRYLKKDKAALRVKGKSLTKPLDSLKSRIPIRTFYSSGERKKPGFRQIDTVGL